MNLFSKVLIVALVAWMALASWWYVCKVKGLCATNTEKVSQQNDLVMNLEGEEEMVFSVSTSNDGAINFQNKREGESVGDASAYLYNNPDKNIAISGHNEHIVESLISTLKIIGVPEDRITYSINSNKNKPTTIVSVGNPYYISANEDSSLVDAEMNSQTENVETESSLTEFEENASVELLEVSKSTLPAPTKPKVWIPCPDVDVSSSYPTIEHVLFSSTSYKVSCTSALKKYAEAAANYIATNGGTVTVTGHTDDDKKQLNNLSLGLKRASEVKKYLIIYGIPPDKIESYSKGDTQPFGSNQTEAGRKLNNRVTIELY